MMEISIDMMEMHTYSAPLPVGYRIFIFCKIQIIRIMVDNHINYLPFLKTYIKTLTPTPFQVINSICIFTHFYIISRPILSIFVSHIYHRIFYSQTLPIIFQSPLSLAWIIMYSFLILYLFYFRYNHHIINQTNTINLIIFWHNYIY